MRWNRASHTHMEDPLLDTNSLGKPKLVILITVMFNPWIKLMHFTLLHGEVCDRAAVCCIQSAMATDGRVLYKKGQSGREQGSVYCNWKCQTVDLSL